MQHYLSNWTELLDALTGAASSSTHHDLKSAIAEILVEVGNVVPEYCRADDERDAMPVSVAA